MAPTNNPAFAQATDRVRALRKSGVSENSLAKAIGVSRTAVRTIMNRGAHHTRGETKRSVLKWVGAGGRGPAEAPRPGRPARGAALAVAPAHRRRRRRRRHGGLRIATTNGIAPAGSHFAQVELEDGRLVRLIAGSRYVLHNGQLLHAV
jgi:DNA invertase Pin-like site-specific DNA recombinase